MAWNADAAEEIKAWRAETAKRIQNQRLFTWASRIFQAQYVDKFISHVGPNRESFINSLI